MRSRKPETESASCRTVALIEDDPDIRAIAELALGEIGGLEVHAYGSGRAAIEGLREREVDVILLDAKMPGMSGEETLTQIRNDPAIKETPAIFVTANSQLQDIERYRNLGARDVIVKPFDPMTLASQVESILLTAQEA